MLRSGAKLRGDMETGSRCRITGANMAGCDSGVSAEGGMAAASRDARSGLGGGGT